MANPIGLSVEDMSERQLRNEVRALMLQSRDYETNIARLQHELEAEKRRVSAPANMTKTLDCIDRANQAEKCVMELQGEVGSLQGQVSLLQREVSSEQDSKNAARKVIQDLRSQLANKVIEADERVKEVELLKKQLASALMGINEAEEKADRIAKDAEQKAECIVKVAEKKAERIVKDAEKKAECIVKVAQKEAEEKANRIASLELQLEAEKTATEDAAGIARKVAEGAQLAINYLIANNTKALKAHRDLEKECMKAMEAMLVKNMKVMKTNEDMVKVITETVEAMKADAAMKADEGHKRPRRP